MTSSWQYPGARWWKFDFHTHTPASKDTTSWQAAIGTPDEVTPEKWLLKYMAAEIDCVAVTDHNSGQWIDKLKHSYAVMQESANNGAPIPGFREIHIFPGIEISVNGGFHLLAIFNKDATTSDIDSLLGKVDYQGTKGESDGVTRRSGGEVVQVVLDMGGIPIPAHVEDADDTTRGKTGKGLLKLRPGSTTQPAHDHNTLQQVLEHPSLLAMEVINIISPKPAIYQQYKEKNKWSEVIGSDCHSFQGAGIPGSRYTWVKMAYPSLEGLRLALLDGQGISIRRSDDNDRFAPFSKPEHFIEHIEICDAQCMGRGQKPAQLRFNPYFNALVGGRGTGKSTVVHALRLAYRRDRELMQGTESAQTFARFNKVAKNRNDDGGLRADTQIALVVNRDGVPYRLTWRQNAQCHIVEEWDEVLREFKPSESQSINEHRFPIRLFSQGQIAALAGDSQQPLLKVVDNAAGTAKAQAAFEEAKSSFFATRAKMRELEGMLKSRDAHNLSLQDIQRKLTRFELTDHAAVLKSYQQTNKQILTLDNQIEAATDLAQKVKDWASQLFLENLPNDLFDADEDADAVQLFNRLSDSVKQAKVQVESVAQQLFEQAAKIQKDLAQSNWHAKTAQATEAYNTLKAELQTQGVNDPAEYGRLVLQKQQLETESKRLDSLQSQLDALKQQADEQLEQIQAARRAISNTREEFLKITLANNPFVRVNLIPYSRDPLAIERSLREVLNTAEGKYKENIYSEAQNGQATGLIADLLLLPSLAESTGEYDTATFESGIKSLQKRLCDACIGAEDVGSWFTKHLQSEIIKRPELPDHIQCWFPEDGLLVEYSRKGDGQEFQSISQASAGQRAAAMLAFLLAHGNEPLVLDQPEDDLDNHLIYDLVVQQIRTNKQRRQLVIVTHNPNIVVNGDAELIHMMAFNEQCFVKQSGSLQDRDMRSEICKVIEGGKDAFERRYQRLGKEI